MESLERDLADMAGGNSKFACFCGISKVSWTHELRPSESLRTKVAHCFRSSQIAVVNAEALKLPEQVCG